MPFSETFLHYGIKCFVGALTIPTQVRKFIEKERYDGYCRNAIENAEGNTKKQRALYYGYQIGYIAGLATIGAAVYTAQTQHHLKELIYLQLLANGISLGYEHARYRSKRRGK